MTRIFFARHGESEWHAENRYAGSSDVGMSPEGFAQAERLGRWASRAGLDAVFSSTATRARGTAAPAAAAAGVALTVDGRLAEVRFGEGEGLTRAEMRDRFPEALDAFIAHPASTPLPGGEEGGNAMIRFEEALGDIHRARPQERVLVVTHSTVVRLVLCRLLGIDPDRYRMVFPRMGNATLTEVDYSPDSTALLGFNVPPADSEAGRPAR